VTAELRCPQQTFRRRIPPRRGAILTFGHKMQRSNFDLKAELSCKGSRSTDIESEKLPRSARGKLTDT
jgi:hypothetical protein